MTKKKHKHFTITWFHGHFRNRFLSVPVLMLCPPFWQTFAVLTSCFYEDTVLLDQHFSTHSMQSVFGPCSGSDSPLWCALVLALLALQPPAINCVLYCKHMNKSTTAPLSVPSISEASPLSFYCVIYARLLPKMSFLSRLHPPPSNVFGISVSSLTSRMPLHVLSFPLLVCYQIPPWVLFISKIFSSFTPSSLSLRFKHV